MRRRALGGEFRLSSLLWSVYAPTFLLATGAGLILPVVPLFAAEFGVSEAMVGLAVAALGIGTMVFDVPAGMLVGRLGARRIMFAGTASLGAVAILTGLSVAFPQFLALRLLAGAAMALWGISRIDYIAATVPSQQRGRAMAMFGGVSRIGAFVGPIAGGYLAVWFGLATPFLAQGALAAVTLALLLVLLKDARLTSQRRQAEHRILARLGSTLASERRELSTAGTAAFAMQFTRASRQMIIPVWGAHIGMDAGEIGLVMGISSAIDMTLFYPVGFIMDRWGRKWVNVPSMLIVGAGLALIPLTDSFLTLMVAGLIAGFGNGLSSGAMMTLGADLAPRDRAGEFLGVWRLIGDSGTAVGPISLGVIAQMATLGTATVASGGVGFFGGAVMLFLVKETLNRRPRQ